MREGVKNVKNFKKLKINSSIISCSSKLLLNSIELLRNSSLKVLEEFEELLSTFDFSVPLDGQIIYEIVKNIDKIQQNNIYKPNMNSVILFLIKLMYKQTNIELGLKAYAYEILIKQDQSNFEEIFIYDLPNISNFKNIKVKFILDFFKSGKEEELFYLMFKDNRIHKFEKVIQKLTNITNIEFVYSFINYYLSNSQNDEVEKGLGILFSIFEFLLSELSKGVEKKYIKKIFNYFLNVLLVRKNIRRYKIARFLLKTNLTNIVFNKKKVFKICKKLLNDSSIRIYEISIKILSIFENNYLVKELETCNDIEKIKIIFRYTKDIDNPIIYSKYLENVKNLTDIDFDIKSLPSFAKIFYNFHDKEVIKYIKLNRLDIVDIYTLDLALHYSKFFPNKIDEEFISSLILEESSNILKNIKIIEILTNIHENLTVQIKSKLIDKFKDLIYQSPYTKSIGLFFNRVGYYMNRETFKDDYILVIYASMNHLDFIKLFNEFVWSTNKFRALIYILQYKPELGVIYHHKLQEILISNFKNDNLSKYNLLEFLYVLKDLLDKDLEDKILNFFYEFIIKNKKGLYELLQIDDLSIKIQTFKLLYKCVIEHILLKEETIPILVIYYKYDKSLRLFNDVIYKNITNIFNMRIQEYKKYNKVYDEYFLKNIYQNKKFEVGDFIFFDDIFLKCYIIYLNFNSINFILENVLLEDKDDIIEKIKKTKIEDIFKHSDTKL